MNRSKIEMSLSENELQLFLKKLSDTKNLTLRKLQKLALNLGIDVSLSSAKTFRDGAFQKHLERLRKARELANQVAEFNSTDSVGSLADAGAAVLMEQCFDEMTSGEIDLDLFSKIISRLRSGDHRLRELNAKLEIHKKQIAELERKENERKAALSKAISKTDKKDITPEFLNEIQKIMGLK